MAARRGEVRLRVDKAHDARGLAAEAGLGHVVAAGDVADIGERHHRLSRSRRRLGTPPCATRQLRCCGRRRERFTDVNALWRLAPRRPSDRRLLAAPCRATLGISVLL